MKRGHPVFCVQPCGPLAYASSAQFRLMDENTARYARSKIWTPRGARIKFFHKEDHNQTGQKPEMPPFGFLLRLFVPHMRQIPHCYCLGTFQHGKSPNQLFSWQHGCILTGVPLFFWNITPWQLTELISLFIHLLCQGRAAQLGEAVNLWRNVSDDNALLALSIPRQRFFPSHLQASVLPHRSACLSHLFIFL